MTPADIPASEPIHTTVDPDAPPIEEVPDEAVRGTEPDLTTDTDGTAPSTGTGPADSKSYDDAGEQTTGLPDDPGDAEGLGDEDAPGSSGG